MALELPPNYHLTDLETAKLSTHKNQLHDDHDVLLTK